MIPKQVTEGFFAVPWHNKIVVGTTDTEKHSIEPIALETEIEFVLETAQRYLVKTHTADVLSFLPVTTIGSQMNRKQRSFMKT
jgi:glycerol-3-phosphate dehydrogenase